MKEIILSTGGVALVNEEDYDWLNAGIWCRNDEGYAKNRRKFGKGKATSMHRLIMDAQPGEVVDHINGDKLDNRRENLRKVTRSQNSMNAKGKPNHRKNKYKGVFTNTNSGRFTARVTKNGVNYVVGSFDTQEEAACAYNEKATELFGEFAKLNEIEEG